MGRRPRADTGALGAVMGGGGPGTAGLRQEVNQRRAMPLMHMELLEEHREARSRAEGVHRAELEAHAELDSELAAVHAEIAQHRAQGRSRPRKDTGAFGALAGDDSLSEAAAHAAASAAPSLDAVPERGGGYRRPRKDTYVCARRAGTAAVGFHDSGALR
jgi:hypothetical protein